jgi:hypothetical protein
MGYQERGTWNADQMNALKENQRYRDDIRKTVESQLRGA